MNYKWVIIIFLIATSFCANAQSKKKSKKRGSLSLIELLSRAEASKLEDPTQSINDLDQLITLAKNADDQEILVSAYALLGEINRNTGLPDLAIKRYDQAISYATKLNKNNLVIPLLQEKGNLLNETNNKEAINNYQLCINLTVKDGPPVKCLEGLGLAYLKAGEIQLARDIFKDLELNQYKNRPVDLSRVQSYQAQLDLESDNYEGAKLNYDNARANFKKGKGASSDYEVLDSTNLKISQNTNSVDDEIQILTENLDYNADLPIEQTKEQVQLADAYARKGDLVNASNTINEARAQISKTKDENLKAQVFKKSSEILAKKGQYAQALEDYKSFESQQALVIKKKSDELQRKIDLLEVQKSIDISENIYSSELKLGRSEAKVGSFQRYIIYLLLALLLTAIFAAWWIFRSLKAQNLANKQLELKSLRGQMNPHFIFNALNSVNEFIATQNPRKANSYLSQFSKLMRSVLDVNKKDLIPLSEEMELTKNYLQLEHARFNDKFDFNFDVEPEVLNSDIEIPPLLLQPYIENSIWHGLRYLDYKGQLNVVGKHIDNYIYIEISDNGIGREKSQQTKTKHQKAHKSTGLKNTSDRIEIVKSLYGKQYDVVVEDLYPEQENKGTKVVIKIFDQ